VRHFLIHSKYATREMAQRTLISKLSPLLRGHIAQEGMGMALKNIYWLRQGVSKEFIAMLLTKMSTGAYPPKEQIQIPQLCVLLKGAVVVSGLSVTGQDTIEVMPCVKSDVTKKQFWNDDMVISLPELKNACFAWTITYSIVDTLTLTDFHEVLSTLPDDATPFRKNFLRFTLCRALIFMSTHDNYLPLQWRELQRCENEKKRETMERKWSQDVTRASMVKYETVEKNVAAERDERLRRHSTRTSGGAQFFDQAGELSLPALPSEMTGGAVRGTAGAAGAAQALLEPMAVGQGSRETRTGEGLDGTAIAEMTKSGQQYAEMMKCLGSLAAKAEKMEVQQQELLRAFGQRKGGLVGGGA
jgi:hypothetical protein